MTTETAAASPSSDPKWLFGPVPDLLIGCGLAYVPVFLLLLFLGLNIQQVLPLAIMPLFALFVSTPHYGSTLLRVYERAEDRRKYQFFSVYLTALIWLWSVAGTQSASVGSALVTVYLIWSPWHYMGQNYGVALMFLGRRGIKISPELKRLVHLSFLCSFFLAATEMQSLKTSAGFFPVVSLELSGGVRDALYLVFGSTYIYSTGRAAWMLLQQTSAKALLPTALLVFSQALWFLVPLLAMRFQLFQGSVALSMDHAVYAFFWVAFAHASQYLWITSYYARKEQSAATVPGFFGKALIAGALIWVLPGLLFAPGVFGNLSYNAGLALLVAAAVNVHHFMLDGAIWKLRNGKIANILLRNATQGSVPTRPRGFALVKPALLAMGMLCVMVQYTWVTSTLKIDRSLEMKDVASAADAIDWLELLRRDDPYMHINLARLASAQGRYDIAVNHVNRALVLEPDPRYEALLREYRQYANPGGS
jgi:hypothetical protein